MLLKSKLQNSTVIKRQSRQQPNSFSNIVKHWMPTVHLALKLEVTLGASTPKCENFVFILKTIMRDRKQSMKRARTAHLAFESDLTTKTKSSMKKNVFLQFSISYCRL